MPKLRIHAEARVWPHTTHKFPNPVLALSGQGHL